MKEYFNRMNGEFGESLKFFLIWKILTTLFIFVGIMFVSRGEHYLGGPQDLFDLNPLLWSAGNFDGSHYLRIARYGYEPLTYFFFPLYPLLINLFTKLFTQINLYNLVLSGIIISNTSFFFAIWGLYKLLLLDFSKKFSRLAIFTLITFPTSAYFGAVYTESLYLALVVWSFYFFRKENYILSGVIGGFSSAARVVGVSLIIAFIANINFRKIKYRHLQYSKLFGIILISLGLFTFMFYLYKTTNNPLMFNTNGNNFGEYRSAEIIILPRVFYRYIYRMLPNLNFNYFIGSFPILLELFTALFLLAASFVGYFVLRKSYWAYLVIGFIMPTLYNSFVSLPRYASVLFPIYILVAAFLLNKNNKTKIVYYLFSVTLMAIVTIMFTRGIWIT